jgi:predicted secreted protein
MGTATGALVRMMGVEHIVVLMMENRPGHEAAHGARPMRLGVGRITPMSPEAASEVVELRVGEEHRVRLAGLATAGYRWSPQIHGDPDAAEVSRAEPEPPASKAAGNSADEVFTIRALRPGDARIHFAQRRSWESDQLPPANERLVEVHVRDA